MNFHGGIVKSLSSNLKPLSIKKSKADRETLTKETTIPRGMYYIKFIAEKKYWTKIVSSIKEIPKTFAEIKHKNWHITYKFTCIWIILCSLSYERVDCRSHWQQCDLGMLQGANIYPIETRYLLVFFVFWTVAKHVRRRYDFFHLVK